MIALDAAFLIAFRCGEDAHREAAHAVLAAHPARGLVMGPLTVAESLVDPARAGRMAVALDLIRELEIKEIPFPEDAPSRLARLRAETGVKMPDCCVLMTAEQVTAAVATFDGRLARAARTLGLDVLPIPG